MDSLMLDPPNLEGAVFNAARRLPIGQRAAFLDDACVGCAALRQRVEELLRAGNEAGEFLQNPVAASLKPKGTIRLVLEPAEKPGDQIGRYKLLQQIGDGGCGVVYMAEQEEPVRRRVALKVIKLGMDTKSVIARFEAERQALALMDHPNIAKVLDAGATDKGRPFFVMELVRGIKITDYCDQNNLSTQARLELFVQVCRAVQHAHQKGIIHRDIKPSNILVTMSDGTPVPKVIDFGIAKATQGKLTDHTLFTAFEQFIGTPAYMSPEQAEMSALDIDTRSDLYSLGVLLYELLTGKTPFDAKELLQAGLDEMRRQIREKEPARPSTRLSTMVAADLTDVAAHRQAAPPKLVHLIRGDLDWIVMKCLEKDRTRRYDTANGLALDIQRHLNNEPVTAAAPTTAYRVRKFVRRHRMGVMAGSFVLLALLAGIVGTTWGLLDALHQKTEAKRQGRIAQHTTDFLTGMFESIDPAQAKLREITVREILDQAGGKIGTAFPNDPLTELPIRRTMCDIYFKLGRYDLALAQGEAALRLCQSVQGDKDSPERAESLDGVARSLDAIGRSTEALPMHEAQLAMCERIYKGDNPNTVVSLNNLAGCLDALGRPAEALPKHEAALAMSRRIHKGDDPCVANVLNDVACCLNYLNRSTEALPKFEEDLAMKERIYKGDHPEVASGLNNVAVCLQSLSRFDEALPKFEAASAMYQRIYKEDHPDVAVSLNNVGECLHWLGRWDEALPKDEGALAMYQRIYKGDHANLAHSLNNVAGCLNILGRSTEALPNCEAALAMYQRLYQGDNRNIAMSLGRIGRCLCNLGHFEEALPKLEAALDMNQRMHPGGDNFDLAITLNDFALCLDKSGRSSEALPKYQALLEMDQRIYKSDHPEVPINFKNFALCLYNLGRPGEAMMNDKAALEMCQRIYKQDNWLTAGIMNQIADCEDAMNQQQEATQTCQKNIALLKLLTAAEPNNNSLKFEFAKIRFKLGELSARSGQSATASENYQQGLSLVESFLANDTANEIAAGLRLSLRAKLGLEKVEVLAQKIAPDSPAHEIGLLPGDVLLKYAGQALVCAADLSDLSHRIKGSAIELEIRRDGDPLKLTVKEGPLGLVCADRSSSNESVQ